MSDGSFPYSCLEPAILSTNSQRDHLSRAASDEVLPDQTKAGRNVLAALYTLTANWQANLDLELLQHPVYHTISL